MKHFLSPYVCKLAKDYNDTIEYMRYEIGKGCYAKVWFDGYDDRRESWCATWPISGPWHSTKEAAMKALDEYLIAHDCVLLTQEQWDKMSLLA